MVEKIFRPWVLNHDEACWLVETAIRTRITRTSRPAPSASHWKLRSPRPRRRGQAAGRDAARGGLVRLGNRAHYDPILLSCALAFESMLEGSGA